MEFWYSMIQSSFYIMAVNNEIGSIQPIEAISNSWQTSHSSFHVDAVQALAKFRLKVSWQNKIGLRLSLITEVPRVQLLALSISNLARKITPLLTGGSQERDYRSTTESMWQGLQRQQGLRCLWKARYL